MVRARFVRRKYNGSISVDVDVDINDVLDEMDDEVLLAECKAREIQSPTVVDEHPDLLNELLDLLRRGEPEEAILLLERNIYPRFGSIELCEKAFAEVRRSKQGQDA